MNRENLKEYKHNQQWIKGRLEYIEEYKTNITNITAALSDMPNGSKQVQDNMAEKLSILIDTINELLEKVVEESKKQKMILEQLDKLGQPYKLILDSVYIKGKSLVKTASEIGYNYEYMRKMNGIALNKFDKLCNKEQKVTEKHI
jgi:hypothetical protein